MVSMVVPLLGNQHPRFLPRVCLPNFSLVFVRLPSPWTLQLDLTRAGARHTLYFLASCAHTQARTLAAPAAEMLFRLFDVPEVSEVSFGPHSRHVRQDIFF